MNGRMWAGFPRREDYASSQEWVQAINLNYFIRVTNEAREMDK